MKEIISCERCKLESELVKARFLTYAHDLCDACDDSFELYLDKANDEFIELEVIED